MAALRAVRGCGPIPLPLSRGGTAAAVAAAAEVAAVESRLNAQHALQLAAQVAALGANALVPCMHGTRGLSCSALLCGGLHHISANTPRLNGCAGQDLHELRQHGPRIGDQSGPAQAAAQRSEPILEPMMIRSAAAGDRSGPAVPVPREVWWAGHPVPGPQLKPWRLAPVQLEPPPLRLRNQPSRGGHLLDVDQVPSRVSPRL